MQTGDGAKGSLVFAVPTNHAPSTHWPPRSRTPAGSRPFEHPTFSLFPVPHLILPPSVWTGPTRL